MARKEVFICDNCGVEVENYGGRNRVGNVFTFQDKDLRGGDFNKFSLGIIRYIDSISRVDKPYLCERCFLKYLEYAVAQLNDVLSIKGVDNAE